MRRLPSPSTFLSAVLISTLVSTALAQSGNGSQESSLPMAPLPSTGTISSSPPEHLSALPSGQASVQSSLPDLGSSANLTLTHADEYQIGRAMMRDLRSQNGVLDDPESTDYLQSIGSRIAVEAQDGSQQFSFFVVRDSSINAFALPVVSSG